MQTFGFQFGEYFFHGKKEKENTASHQLGQIEYAIDMNQWKK